MGKHLIRRKGTKPGDIVAVTGEFGYTGALFAAILHGYKEPNQLVEVIQQKALRPRARFLEGQTLAKEEVVSAAIDSSDGLAWSLHELSTASRVGFHIDDLRIPETCREFAESNELDPVEFVLYGGEEFELVVTIPVKLWSEAQKAVENKGGHLLRIGKAIEEPLKILTFEGEERIIEPRGYEHFSK